MWQDNSPVALDQQDEGRGIPVGDQGSVSASAPLPASSLGDLFPFLAQIALAVSQAEASGGVQVPIHSTAHSHEWTLILNGTLDARRGSVPAGEPLISSIGPFSVGEVG